MKTTKVNYEYMRQLETYFEITANRSGQYAEDLIEKIRENKMRFKLVTPWNAFFLTLFFTLLRSFIKSMLLLWAINEILEYPVTYSLYHISMLSLLMFAFINKVTIF